MPKEMSSEGCVDCINWNGNCKKGKKIQIHMHGNNIQFAPLKGKLPCDSFVQMSDTITIERKELLKIRDGLEEIAKGLHELHDSTRHK
jgi:hypothetical protein